MRKIFLAGGVVLALSACSSIETHRAACAGMLGRPLLTADPAKVGEPGGPVEAPAGAKPQPIDPAVEGCAQARAAQERAEAALVAAVILGGAVAGAAAGAARGAVRSPVRATYYRPAYRPAYRPSFRRY